MTPIKRVAVGLTILAGAGLMATQAPAAPLGNLNTQLHAPGSNIELVQEKKWKYDRRRHGDRRDKRDKDFRFHFNGFWYASPFWMFAAPQYVERYSCGEARRILRRRYDGVRTIECSGRIYSFGAVNNRGRLIRINFNSNSGNYWRV